MKKLVSLGAGIGLLWAAATAQPAERNVVIGWNDLGMHCMDGLDESVFSILPPFNTIHAQVIRQGILVVSTNAVTVAYQAVADAAGSFNSTSAGKVSFWDYSLALYGASLAPDMGLKGFGMPGASNLPQQMALDPAVGWFSAEGIPIVPYDDAGRKNPYPMMRLTARDSASNILATTDIVLPVSDEMDCRACHQSGGQRFATPIQGWAWHYDREKDYKLNILAVHDDNQALTEAYTNALIRAGYSPEGLYATVVQAGKPVLCAKCHASNALPGTGQAGLSPLTQAIHSRHDWVPDPDTGISLGASANRSACYRCHPGAATRCLRGAMGAAVASDGTMSMACQNCHGNMSRVGAAGRPGWLDEPQCQNCHTGTAVSNNGQIRFTSVFDNSGQPRQAVNSRFAVSPNVPAPGASLFRFSRGHGGLYCSACHGSPHAEYPSLQPNDNVQNQRLQGHAGVLSDCAVCHAIVPNTAAGGPHGMHPVGQSWISAHPDYVESTGAVQCQACHGADYRGTVLSRALGNRTLSAFGTKQFWQGFQIGCYACHQGPDNGDANPNLAPQVTASTASTLVDNPVAIQLTATDSNLNPLTLRVVSQPAHGTVALTNQTALYYPEPGFAGTDIFTFAASDGFTDSNLGQGTVAVQPGPVAIRPQPLAPLQAKTGQRAPFRANLKSSHYTNQVAFAWNFGDNTPQDTNQFTSHIYAAPGTYNWQLTVGVLGAQVTTNGVITIAGVVEMPRLQVERQGDRIVLTWPIVFSDFKLQSTGQLSATNQWTNEIALPSAAGEHLRWTNPVPANAKYYRLIRY